MLALAALAASGCVELQPPPTPVPMVLVEETLRLDPAPDAMLELTRFPCDTGTYTLDPPRVRTHLAPRGTPDFLVILERATLPDSGGPQVYTPMSSSGDGSLWQWTLSHALPGGRDGGSTRFDLGTPFRDGPPDGLSVGWRDGHAWVGDEPLEEGTPVERRLEYEVRAPDGTTVHVEHTWRATYLGHGYVTKAPVPDECPR